MQFGIGVRAHAVPRPPGPRQVLKAGVAALMQPRAHIHEPLGLRDQARQNIRGQRIHREHVRQPVNGCNPVRFLVTDRRVVDYGVEYPCGVRLFCDALRFRDDGEISEECLLRAWDERGRLPCPVPVARVQDDLVSVRDEEPRGHEPESVGRACDEYPCHL